MNHADNAVWWVAACGAFVAWQIGRWLVERGRWQATRKAGAHLPAPRFLDGPAGFLADVAPVLLGLVQLAAGLAWTMFAIFGIGVPLFLAHGPVAGVAGGLLVWGTGMALAVSALTRLGERQRRERELIALRAAAGTAR